MVIQGSSGRDRAAEQQRSFTAAFRTAGLGVEELWTEYFGVGGDAGFLEVDAYVHGMTALSARDRDMLAHVVNEYLDLHADARRAAYSRPFRNPRPTTPPLSALVELVDGVHLAAPDRLPVIAHAAGTALGVELTVHLVDYEQRALRPATGTGAPPLDLDTTTAGRAFRELEALATTDRSPTLWMPLLDGIERLGVLEIGVPEPEDLRDPGLRAHCRWVARLLGHLITITTHYGDGLDRTRLTENRTPNAELLWSLLPPRTAGVGDVVVSAAVEPRYDLRGDVFDYALSETAAQLLILDAAGDELVAATALAAYRSARHAGGGLLEQARSLESTLAGRFGAGRLATAVLAELDFDSGRLRYLNAGHIEPLIMRGGTVADPLGAERHAAFGLGAEFEVVAEDKIHPEDWLVFHTDGITATPDPGGEPFGLERLIEVLRREAGSGHPPPETVRQVVTAVREHHRAVLRADATVMLVRKLDRATAPRRPEDERR
ncbi:PP2C family protein-serine/threonine phosphatase [Nocardia sp. NPDC050697]|uniref:PP2C family protein-serine/threonine phosphatase n=1 Tax=Nocardia sp. NPDC050697 TaxID=3155158 RepID=UPI0033C9F3E3